MADKDRSKIEKFKSAYRSSFLEIRREAKKAEKAEKAEKVEKRYLGLPRESYEFISICFLIIGVASYFFGFVQVIFFIVTMGIIFLLDHITGGFFRAISVFIELALRK